MPIESFVIFHASGQLFRNFEHPHSQTHTHTCLRIQALQYRELWKKKKKVGINQKKDLEKFAAPTHEEKWHFAQLPFAGFCVSIQAFLMLT